ncbi:branched-chain amino acid ABC transporter permease [Pusillimonas sp.]|uniref:branched-chain amino acid ABC transporter permease n=1 Tax=Pusillimonas sp. TaxID=3040095 RepID=UPI0029A4521E|nr:branched-chain amino acid ABC transporter permease [Pusillimonas sp.]MDX3894637.1 branched-chain amino acid ABC transporter permease [Pusillimonas sp.]
MHDRITLTFRGSHILTSVLVTAALAFMLVGIVKNDTFYLRLGTEALIFAGLALSVDLLLGYTGLLSLGQAMYFGIGAYTSAVVLIHTSSFWLAMAASLAASLITAAVGGVIANQVRGVYFALITFALAQVAAKVVYNSQALGASDGLIGIPVVDVNLGVASISTSSPAGFFMVALTIIIGLYSVMAWLLNTPFGRVLIALKANERRVPFLGYSVWRARMVAYVLAGVVAGMSGALYPMLRGFVSPELLFFSTSGNALISVILGGVGTLVGALFGSIILIILKSVISTYTTHHLIVIGSLFIVLVLFVPQGLAGYLRPYIVGWLERRSSKQTQPVPAVAILKRDSS